MSDIKKLIRLILSDEKLMSSKSMKNKVYTDEPIIKVASKLSNYVPAEITRLVKQFRSIGFYNSNEAEFFRHAQMMKNFEDNCEYDGEFSCYYPTYRDMSIAQLRGYFTWRAAVRKGRIEKTSISYAFVYIYELLHLVGVSSPEKGYEALCRFHEVYGALDPRINTYMKTWLTDFVVYYNLDKSLLDTAADDALAVISDSANHSDTELFSAIKALSSYKIEKSKFYKQYPDDVQEITCRVYKALSVYYEKHRKNTLPESLFGQKISSPYRMFSAAVFYDYRGYDDYEYIVSEVQKYRCTNGKWTCEKYHSGKDKNRRLGDIIRTIDSVMRDKYNFGHPTNRALDTSYVLKIIEKEIDLLLEEHKKNSVTKIEIDVSKLQGIRTAAAITRDKLIVDEEYEAEEPSETLEDAVCEPENNSPLDDAEYEFMQCLLYGGDCASAAKKHGRMLSVIADSINEKLFDMFGDTVIAFDGDTPELIEDYTEDLKGIVRQ